MTDYISLETLDDKEILFIGDKHTDEKEINFKQILEKYDMTKNVLLLSETTENLSGNLGRLYSMLKKNKTNKVIQADIRTTKYSELDKLKTGVIIFKHQKSLLELWNQEKKEEFKNIIKDNIRENISPGLKTSLKTFDELNKKELYNKFINEIKVLLQKLNKDESIKLNVKILDIINRFYNVLDDYLNRVFEEHLIELIKNETEYKKIIIHIGTIHIDNMMNM